MMTVRTIETWLRLVQLKMNLHGHWSYGGKWVRLRNNLRRELARSMGRNDFMDAKGCRSVDGCYLEGYHDGDAEVFRYVTWNQLLELKR